MALRIFKNAFNKEVNACQRECNTALVGLPDDVRKSCRKICIDDPMIDPYGYVDSIPREQQYWAAEGLLITGLPDEGPDNTTVAIGLAFIALIGFLIWKFAK